MEKFIPYEKLSKKKQRELDRKKRGTWDSFSPTTRVVKSAKVYDRKKQARTWREDAHDRVCFVCYRCSGALARA